MVFYHPPIPPNMGFFPEKINSILSEIRPLKSETNFTTGPNPKFYLAFFDFGLFHRIQASRGYFQSCPNK